MKVNPQISVAILTWNRREHVVKAIKSVLQQTYAPLEIIVVDSASNDGTVELIKKTFPTVKIISLHQNLGCPEGRNVAMANCKGEYIFCLDDDGWLPPNTLEVCVDRFKTDNLIGVIACQIIAPTGNYSTYTLEQFDVTFNGGACAIKREALQEVGYYPSDFFRQAEERDLGLRLIAKGYKILRCPKAIMYHELSPINRNYKKFFYFGCRNELYTVIRRYPFCLVLPSFIQKTLRWNLEGIKKGAFFYTLMGTGAGMIRMRQLFTYRDTLSVNVFIKFLEIREQGKILNNMESRSFVNHFIKSALRLFQKFEFIFSSPK